MDAIYARQSVDKKDSISIEAQIEKCVFESAGDYIIFSDKGFSGKNMNRPSFKKMMSLIKKGGINRIIVYRIDRISRSIADFSGFWQILEKNGVDFLSVNERFDTSTPIGRAMLYIIMSFAQLERETIAERVRDNYYARLKRGVWTGGTPPLGFSPKHVLINGKRASVLEANDDAEIVKKIFSCYYNGESLGGVAKKAALMCDSRYWDGSAVSRILKNPVYAICDADVYNYYSEKGYMVENGIEGFNGEKAGIIAGRGGGNDYFSLASHKGLIESKVFLYCNRRLDLNMSKSAFSYGKYSFLSGKLKCGVCGKNIKIIMSKRKKYLFCSKGCEGTHCADINGIEHDFSKEMNDVCLRYLNIHLKKEINNELELKIKKLIKAIEDFDGICKDYINERIEFLNSIKSQENCEIDSNIESFDFNNLSFYEKKIFIGVFIEKITIEKDIVTVYYKF